jgi:hypothetical protein
MKRSAGIIRLSCAAVLCTALSGCAASQPLPETPPPVEFVGRPAPVPAGVVRYCWKEPKTVAESAGPGLNEEGTWYLPAQTNIREVRQGYWVECGTGKRVEMR